jgi:hypothetical protein
VDQDNSSGESEEESEVSVEERSADVMHDSGVDETYLGAADQERTEIGDPAEVFVDLVEDYPVDFCVDDRDGHTVEPLAGRLLRRLDRWKCIGAEQMIKTGLAPEWGEGAPPEQLDRVNPVYTGEKHELMVEEIQKELDTGVIEEVELQ